MSTKGLFGDAWIGVKSACKGLGLGFRMLGLIV